MEAAALFAVGGAAGIQVACLLAVTDVFDERGGRTRIDDHALVGAVEAMGTVAADHPPTQPPDDVDAWAERLPSASPMAPL